MDVESTSHNDSFFSIPMVLICTTIIILTLFWIRRRSQSPSANIPPGPKPWPILGFLPDAIRMRRQDGFALHQMHNWLGKNFGPVSTTYIFGIRVVVVNGYKAVNELLNRHDLNARSSHGTMETQNGVPPIHQTGILRSSGDLWKELRKFSLTTLRGFGVGKRSFEEHIAEESKYLLEELASTNGSPYDPTVLLCNGVSNVICSVVFGKRHDYSEQKYQYFVHMIDEKIANPESLLAITAFPILGKFPFGPTKKALKQISLLRDYYKEMVDEHVKTFDPDNPRDFIDVYLNEISLRGQDTLQDKLFADNILAVLDDFFLAGTETTSTTLRWALLYMMNYPKIQTKIQQEIDTVVGRDRLPKLSDKVDLPYVEAVLHEIQRHASIIHTTGPRYVPEDTTFEGYDIPKGTFLIPNLYSTTRDPSIWQDPDDFYPERFLDDNGCVNKPKQLMVFGSGRRVCLGEQLARMELYIIFTHLLHRFTFKKPDESTILDLKPKVTTVMAPKSYELCAVERD
ncbi:cytochrome P450 2F3-like [Amphiura filiformis]|uniref:cytochrome P450 2F3-like n=1 Tax=Amphiura filiformis TaxID=82378 RepID=UPI003B2112D7